MREPERIEVESNGHRFIWLFRPLQAYAVERLIEQQYTLPHEGFEKLRLSDAYAAMREARGYQQQLIAKGAMR